MKKMRKARRPHRNLTTRPIRFKGMIRNNTKGPIGIHRYIFNDGELTNPHMITDNKHLPVDSITRYYEYEILQTRKGNNESTYIDEFKVIGDRKSWTDYINLLDKDETITLVSDSAKTGLALIRDANSYFIYNVSNETIEIRIVGSLPDINHFKKEILENFRECESTIQWVYSSDGSFVTVNLRADRKPFDEMFPNLPCSLEDYYDKFHKSSSSVLLLIGPPGTGKTSFIRGYMNYTKSNGIVTYDEDILKKDFVFAEFIEDTDTSVMIVEDADNFLTTRADGNNVMHKFLNVGDGLITASNKKLIFSTNLPNINSIDSALVRAGRCFDILKFDYLNEEQALKFANKIGTQLDKNEKGCYSIADIFNREEKQNMKEVGTNVRKIGFV